MGPTPARHVAGPRLVRAFAAGKRRDVLPQHRLARRGNVVRAHHKVQIGRTGDKNHEGLLCCKNYRCGVNARLLLAIVTDTFGQRDNGFATMAFVYGYHLPRTQMPTCFYPPINPKEFPMQFSTITRLSVVCGAIAAVPYPQLTPPMNISE